MVGFQMSSTMHFTAGHDRYSGFDIAGRRSLNDFQKIQKEMIG